MPPNLQSLSPAHHDNLYAAQYLRYVQQELRILAETPSEIAYGIVFSALVRATYTTGQLIRINICKTVS
jgi:hypothetical protein